MYGNHTLHYMYGHYASAMPGTVLALTQDMAKPNDSASLQHKHDKVPRQVADIIKVYRIRRLVSMSPDTISWHESCYASHHGKIRCGQ